MSFVPKYQWLTEKKDNACGNACDVVQIDAMAEKKFQVAFTPTVLLNQNFDGNNIGLPMEKIWVGLGSLGSGSGTGEYYGITFDIDTTNDNHFINAFSFTYEGQSYCYIFQRVSYAISGDYELIEYGSFRLVRYEDNVYFKYIEAFNHYMNDFGISAIANGTPSITVYGFPENTQVITGDTSPYNTDITDGVGLSTFTINNFVPLNNQLCYFNLYALSDGIGATCNPYIRTNQIIVSANKRMTIIVNYENNFNFDLDIELRIKDDSLVLIDTIAVTAQRGTNNLIFNYITSATPPTAYYFEFALSDISCAFAENYNGFCFNDINIQTIEKLNTITAVGCTTQTVPFTEEYNDIYNSLITMNTGSLSNGLMTSGKWKLLLTDTANNTFESIIYETISGESCLHSNLMRFKWNNDCNFANLDYVNLPFTNDVYIKGYYTSQPYESKERVINTLSNGETSLVFDYSVEKKEFSIGLYTESFFTTLQRAFLHSTIIIDNLYYKQDTDSKLTKKPEGKKFSAKIELIEVGSEVVISKCCC
jgi:hypothetical protein